MTQYNSDFIRTIVDRGYLHQCTDLDAVDVACQTAPVPAYIGFDCTAPSLHVGSLLPIMLLRILQKTGHKPIVLMGGGTTRVGDPSGKDKSRQLLDDAKIASNMEGIKSVFAKYLTFGDGPTDAIMVNNADWLDTLEYIPFLRTIGQHFSINRMLAFENVKIRLEREQPLTFLEFNYMILQAYDFLELNRRFKCRLQMGGSDQWGNIVNGVELARRVDAETVFGLTSPLITTASGAKMGKTTEGAVWLNEEMLSAYDFWQYWRNTADADVGRFLRLYTELPLDEIVRLEALEGQDVNDAKIILANTATALCHGNDKATTAEATAQRTFAQGGAGDGLPTIDIPRDELAVGIPAFDLLRRAGLAKSGGDARRLIKGGGAKINDQVLSSETEPVTLDALNEQGFIKLSAGKKRHCLIKLS